MDHIQLAFEKPKEEEEEEEEEEGGGIRRGGKKKKDRFIYLFVFVLVLVCLSSSNFTLSNFRTLRPPLLQPPDTLRRCRWD